MNHHDALISVPSFPNNRAQSFIFLKWLQILLDDLKVSEQLIDLVFYTLTVLSNRQVSFQSTFLSFAEVKMIVVIMLVLPIPADIFRNIRTMGHSPLFYQLWELVTSIYYRKFFHLIGMNWPKF